MLSELMNCLEMDLAMCVAVGGLSLSWAAFGIVQR